MEENMEHEMNSTVICKAWGLRILMDMGSILGNLLGTILTTLYWYLGKPHSCGS